MGNVTAYYLWPAVWVGESAETNQGIVDLSMLNDEIHRASLSAGLTVKVCRQGLFLFDFSSYAPIPDSTDFDSIAGVILRRVEVMNAHLACLYSSIGQRHDMPTRETMVVSPHSLISADALDGGKGMAFGNDPLVTALTLSEFESTYSMVWPKEFDWRLRSRLVLDKSVVVDPFSLLDGLLAHPSQDVIMMADLYLRSCRAYEDHNYSLCLVMAWAITEVLLDVLWERFINAKRDITIDGQKVRAITKERKDKLQGRDFTASIVSEILSLSGDLPFQLYKDLSVVRARRNDWLHQLATTCRATAGLSLTVTERMLALIHGVSLQVPRVTQLHT